MLPKSFVILLTAWLAPAAVSAVPPPPEYPKMGPDIYDVRASGDAMISAALTQAEAAHKHVLLDLGANWCIWCRRLHQTFETNPAVAAALKRDFVLVLIDVNHRIDPARNQALIARYDNPVRFGLPVLVVLDEHGHLLHTEDSGNLEEGGGHSPAKILAFFDRWR